MPHETTDAQALREAIRKLDSLSELFDPKYKADLETIVSGRPYGKEGGTVGPYARLLTFAPGEEVIREGDWGGNTFYLLVEGLLDVYIKNEAGEQRRIDRITPGASFGEMSVLAGVPRNATVLALQESESTVLEIARPALRLLRKLPKFGREIDQTYRANGLNNTLENIQQATGELFTPELLARLGQAGQFMVYGKNHALILEKEPIEKIYFIRNGWVRRARGIAYDPVAVGVAKGFGAHPVQVAPGNEVAEVSVDFLGAGNCLGLASLKSGQRVWSYSATIMTRTEVLEVETAKLEGDPELQEKVWRAFERLSRAGDHAATATAPDQRFVAAAEEEIMTGIVDAENLLVMDMDLCIRCGNCSLACHQVHGQSRLLRRGIHLERPVKLESTATQHILVPQVCIHCQDPECLTGCPTGAIARLANGQIDIDPQTCIGCNDCPSQCPYNAISMVPRDAPPPVSFSVINQLKGWLNLAPPAIPAPLPETKETVAIKCNLCENTPLNPPGARRKAYSCEENCPTGALVRVNPREYFTEVNDRLGLVYRDQTHAIGRNIHKSDPLATIWRIGGLLLALALTIAGLWAIGRYGSRAALGGTWLNMRWLTGIAGLAGLAIVMLYPARRRVYKRRAGALRYWLLAHVYVGIMTAVVLFLHGGRHGGGLLTTTLMVTFDLVILSGLFGIACYFIVPRLLTSIEGEPLLIEDLQMRRNELRAEIAGAAQGDDQLSKLIEERALRPFRSFGFLMRQYARREELSAVLAQARSKIREAARDLSEQQKDALLKTAEAAITLRRVDALIYLHQLLKLWLIPHIISTSLMLALMVVHVFQVIFFTVH